MHRQYPPLDRRDPTPILVSDTGPHVLSIVQPDPWLTVENDLIRIVNRVIVSALSDFTWTRERTFDREEKPCYRGGK